MFSLRAHILISVGCLALMFALAGAFHGLQLMGVVGDPREWAPYAMGAFFGLFLAFGFSMIPLGLKLFIRGQQKIGNAAQPMIVGLARNEAKIVWGAWAFLAAGLALAIPAAIEDGFFTPEDAEPAPPVSPGPSLGLLTARPGMAVDEMRANSTLELADDAAAANSLELVFSGGGPFDFQIADSPTIFRQCRYYFINTFSASDRRIQAISIGTSPTKLSKAALDAANRALQRSLAAQGWRSGHEEYRTAENQALHGGARQGPAGWIWLRQGTILHLMNRRLDDPKPGEDASSAGDWIQYVDLWQKADYPGIEYLVFEGAAP